MEDFRGPPIHAFTRHSWANWAANVALRILFDKEQEREHLLPMDGRPAAAPLQEASASLKDSLDGVFSKMGVLQAMGEGWLAGVDYAQKEAAGERRR